VFFNPHSRRYFLRGLGVSLALPFLPSVMRKAYAASTPPVRFIQVMNAYGQFPYQYFTADNALTPQGTSGIYAKPLSAISGDFSQVIGSAFTPMKNKFSVLRGLSVLTSDGTGASEPRHNSSLPSCASGTSSDNNESSPPIYPYSVDTVMSESAKIYPNPAGMQRHVNFSPGTERYPNFSWNKLNGSIQQMPTTRVTSGLLAKFAPLTNGTVPPPTDPKQQRNAKILNSVYGDYKALRDDTRLAAADKSRLDAYMTLISQVEAGLQTQAPASCAQPAAEAEVDVNAMTRNQINVLVAAMACQLTRVGAIALSLNYDTYHVMGHIEGVTAGQQPAYAAIQSTLAKNVAYLMSMLDMVSEGGGTMLDNSIVYWGNEYGENLTTTNVGDKVHSPINMNVLVAGGGNGMLQMGQYIDYRQTGGMPLNNLLVSFFNAMGLSSADYERDGVAGFGEYDVTGAAKNLSFSPYLTTSARRSGLPYFYKGPAMG
jgi:hypothetical protein